MSIEIIGAGFPRTGTTTLKKALEILGYDKTYHFKDLVANPDDLKYWKELEETGSTDFENLFKGYRATSDFPAYPYYKILLKKYPDAKIILTKRDPDAWYKSTYDTIWQAGPQNLPAKLVLSGKMLLNSHLRKKMNCIKFMRKIYLSNQFGGEFGSEQSAKSTFINHIKEVSENVPKEKLLIYEVADGWEPLCKFLRIDIPQVPFPHLNKNQDFHKMVKKMIRQNHDKELTRKES